MTVRPAVRSVADRPDLVEAMDDLTRLWPSFMLNDPIADLYYPRCATLFPDTVFVAEDPEHPGTVVGRAYSVPFALRGDELPDDGWDAVVRWGAADVIDDRPPTHVSALEIAIVPEYRSIGLAEEFLAAMRRGAIGRGAELLVAPVRPTCTARRPDEPFDAYASRLGDDRLPADPWLRTHVRAGGRLVRIAPRSMTIAGTLAEWREWTGQPFDRSGPVAIDRGLAPVVVDVDRDLGVYIEPNVWVEHPLRP